MFIYFLRKNKIKPLRVPRVYGYVDAFIELVFGSQTGDLNHQRILADQSQRFSLFRLIMMTEKRGLKQVQAVLRQGWVKRNSELVHLFQVIESDEPSHFEPYEAHLELNGAQGLTFKERLADLWIHYSLMLLKLPFLYLSVLTPALTKFPHEDQELKDSCGVAPAGT